MLILIALLVIIAAFVAFVSVRPGAFRIERSAFIEAPAPTVFEQVNDFHNWENWSPWAKIDPAMKQTFEGAPSGTGAIYTWDGNAKAGVGRMDILESRPYEFIQIKLRFLKPFAATNTGEFTFTPECGGTRVDWAMYGENAFAAKAFGLFMNMDKVVGDDFAIGLAAMKSVSEAEAKTA